MYLSKWLELTQTSHRGFAKKLGNISATSIIRWSSGKRFPRPNDLIAIEEITDGAVTANDFVKQLKEAQLKEKLDYEDELNELLKDEYLNSNK